MVLLGVSAAVDIDLFGLMASVVLAIALVPFGIQLIKAPTKPFQGRFRHSFFSLARRVLDGEPAS